jgi:hypothetical protein
MKIPKKIETIKSPSSRGAWIETKIAPSVCFKVFVALRKGGGT